MLYTPLEREIRTVAAAADSVVEMRDVDGLSGTVAVSFSGSRCVDVLRGIRDAARAAGYWCGPIKIRFTESRTKFGRFYVSKTIT